MKRCVWFGSNGSLWYNGASFFFARLEKKKEEEEE